ncbi:MAG: hypothetical protein ACLQJL_07195 [Roseiarcus sp.]
MIASVGNEALIAEVGGAGRWSQIAFTFNVVRDYFETQPDSPYEICLRHVLSSGALQAAENESAIYKPNSSNWCFELGAARDRAYPGIASRPIVVFLRVCP